MYQVYNDEEIYHYGIRGMHWGQRMRSNISSGTIKNIGQATVNASGHGSKLATSRFSSKNLKEAKMMSDEDLKQKAQRLELENRYMNAQAQQQGKSAVMNVLNGAAAIGGLAVTGVTLYNQIRGGSSN